MWEREFILTTIYTLISIVYTHSLLYPHIHTLSYILDVVLNELWPLFLGLSSDAQDSVRLLSVEICLSFGDVTFFGPKFVEESLLPVVLKLAGDRSWRVRYLVGASFTGLLENVFIPISGGSSLDALTIFTTLLGDSEAEVRTASARQLAGSCAHFPQVDFEKKILPVLRALSSDSSVSVRAAVATQLNPLSAIAGAELAASALFPLYTHFFADESSQVRLNAVSKMDVVCQVMGIEKLSQSILPAIIQLAEDKQVRQCCLNYKYLYLYIYTYLYLYIYTYLYTFVYTYT